jgi:flagellar biosynthesis chaperone FliJ
MTALTDRRQRMLRIRTLQQRKAQLELAHAHQGLAHIASVASRIDALAAQNHVPQGASDGMTLAANWTTTIRLNTASAAAQAALQSASLKVECQQAALVQARIDEQCATRLVEKAQQDERSNEQRRMDALCFKTARIGADQ